MPDPVLGKVELDQRKDLLLDESQDCAKCDCADLGTKLGRYMVSAKALRLRPLILSIQLVPILRQS